ncbi:hypothetical protein ANN_16249 [Periplaneta americana]|uniref:Uncharacterized protein n=1 Tax=Periplaneta americana TaxID=6978 RepID=A0ABQ8SIG0_PERAM|nr:hypothetical protein ANN_16249 [Periplaneta americana]
MYPEIPLPPKPILTRWGTWLEAVEYYAEHIDSINNVLLALDSEDAVSIDTAKTVTCDISVKNDLAHIQHTFSCIIKTLKSLQNRHLSLSESFEIINSTVEQLNRGRGKVADAVRAKVDTVLSKNPGYEELQKDVAVMSGESTVKINLDLSPADIVKLNYVPVTSCDVERSFSQYKSILRDNRRRFTFQHLKEMFVTYCYDTGKDSKTGSQVLSEKFTIKMGHTHGPENANSIMRNVQNIQSRAIDVASDPDTGLLIRSCVRAWVGSPFGLIEWFLPRFSPAVRLRPDGLWRVLGINPFDLITWLGFSEVFPNQKANAGRWPHSLRVPR